MCINYFSKVKISLKLSTEAPRDFRAKTSKLNKENFVLLKTRWDENQPKREYLEFNIPVQIKIVISRGVCRDPFQTAIRQSSKGPEAACLPELKT